MEIALWIVAGLVCLFYLVSGGMKIFAIDTYRTQAAWAKDVNNTLVRVVGVLEVLGAIGIVLPQLTGIGAPVLTILAALGLVLVQVVAVVIHVVRKEYASLPINVVLIILPLFVLLGHLLWV